jgi:hypothetical protein
MRPAQNPNDRLWKGQKRVQLWRPHSGANESKYSVRNITFTRYYDLLFGDREVLRSEKVGSKVVTQLDRRRIVVQRPASGRRTHKKRDLIIIV